MNRSITRITAIISSFLGAFLLFQLQLIIGKKILPWYGGVSSVWTTVLLFFQVVVLLGYAYANFWHHMKSNIIKNSLHFLIFVGSIAAIIIATKTISHPLELSNPLFDVLIVLTLATALPGIFLSTTAPTIQSVMAKSFGDKVYSLYVWSNAGSLIGLISYPLIIEPNFSLPIQGLIWVTLFIIYGCAYLLTIIFEKIELQPKQDSIPYSLNQKLEVGGIVMFSTILLLSVTTKITTDLASFPLLWVIPLALYLLTFIVAFMQSSKKRWVVFISFALGLLSISLGLTYPIFLKSNIMAQMLIWLGFFWLITLVLHLTVERKKPQNQNLTFYYLMLAIGGALGGIFAGAIAPLIFSGYYELYIGIIGSLLIMIWSWRVYLKNEYLKIKKNAHKGYKTFYFFIIIVIILQLASYGLKSSSQITKERNFYGVVMIKEKGEPRVRTMLSGTTDHGKQIFSQELMNQPTSYYGRASAVGRSIDFLRTKKETLNIGVIGLGTGTLATYGIKGDKMTFYEIDVDVTELAKKYFTYLSQGLAQTAIIHGDARISLQKELPQNFDYLLVDAFQSDAIPVHLLTEEAFRLYFSHMSPAGILDIHISNRHLDLNPVVCASAKRAGWVVAQVNNEGEPSKYVYSSIHMLVARTANDLPTGVVPDQSCQEVLWTDQYSSVLKVLR